jgi:hypothetical protein
MAARRKARHDDETRRRIQAAKLIDRGQAFAFGEIEMSRDQAWALFRLLDKVLPNLSSVEHGGDPDNPIHHIARIERVIVDSKNTDGEGVPAAPAAGEV